MTKKRKGLDPRQCPKTLYGKKVHIKIENLSYKLCHWYECKGYIYEKRRKVCIGHITASVRKSKSAKYLQVNGAFLDRKYTGKRYGHVLYWALAKKAVRVGYKGIKSDRLGRNVYSNGAWAKMANFERGDYSYLKFK